MMNLFLWQSLVVYGASPLLYFLIDKSVALSFLMGGTLLIFSIAIYGIAFILIFKQKLVALAPILIVSKYAILGILIPKLVDLDWLNSIWFGLGFCSIAFGGLLYAVEQAFKSRENKI